jgi:aminoglycoside phosphotransferase (APT) family kinase protein
MTIPAEMRRKPPPSTLAWVERAVGRGSRVVRVRRLRNAWAAAMHAVDVERAGTRHRLVLRRWARADIPPEIGAVENEAAVLGVLDASRVPAPRLVAVDARGDLTDAPTVLMTRVPGRDMLSPPDVDTMLAGLAETLHLIHAVDVPPGVLNYYRPWGLDTVLEPPPWSRRPDVWARAIEVAHEPVPAHTRVLCHRDFHPGNVLWLRGRVSGIVDWTAGCRGPAAADVAHCRSNLALLFGQSVADNFARRYGALADLAWHDIADVVSTGEEVPEAWRWHDAGRSDVTVEHIIDARDEFLAQALTRLG